VRDFEAAEFGDLKYLRNMSNVIEVHGTVCRVRQAGEEAARFAGHEMSLPRRGTPKFMGLLQATVA